jgi:SAM-dependent methyltransferase
MTVDAVRRAAPSSYAERFAEQYDDWFGFAAPTTETVELLHGLAGPAPVLELGIGTGRVALPLSARGVQVRGVEASREMAARLRAQPGGDRIQVTIGDFGEVPVDESFSLIYVAAGTFFELRTQEAQLGCFLNAARRLTPGGTFVLDALLPEALNSPELGNGRVVPTANGDLVVLYRRVARATQRYDSHYVITTDAGVRHVHVQFRYTGAGELDLMARIAGLRLRQRYGTWAATPFDDRSLYHVSVYELAE